MKSSVVAEGKHSLLVDLNQLATTETDIALWLQLQPKVILDLLHDIAKDQVLLQYPEYHATHKEIFVRIEALVEENIRDLR